MVLLDLEKVNATVGPGEALTNTLIGMGTVFVVLILISIIIFLLKFVPKMFERKKAEPVAEKKEKPVVKEAKPVSAAADDTQIIAVITAAIAAQMEAETGVCVPADGLVIRSIKKRTFN